MKIRVKRVKAIVETDNLDREDPNELRPCSCDVANSNRMAIIDIAPQKPSGYAGFIPSCPECYNSRYAYYVEEATWQCVLCHPGCEHDPAGPEDVAKILGNIGTNEVLNYVDSMLIEFGFLKGLGKKLKKAWTGKDPEADKKRDERRAAVRKAISDQLGGHKAQAAMAKQRVDFGADTMARKTGKRRDMARRADQDLQGLTLGDQQTDQHAVDVRKGTQMKAKSAALQQRARRRAHGTRPVNYDDANALPSFPPKAKLGVGIKKKAAGAGALPQRKKSATA